eukprot:403341534
MDERELHIEVINRETDHINKIQVPKNDIIHLVNSKANTTKPPLFIRFSDQKLDLVTFKDDEQIHIDLFRNFNNLNPNIITTSTVSSVYSEELVSQFVLFILRKDNDDKGLLFRIAIPRNVINKVFKLLENNTLDQIKLLAPTIQVQQHSLSQAIPRGLQQRTQAFQMDEEFTQDFMSEPDNNNLQARFDQLSF